MLFDGRTGARADQLTQLAGCYIITTAQLLNTGGAVTFQRPVAYVISAVEGFADEVTVRRYAELAGPAIEHFGGRFIVSNAEPVVVEGESPSGHLSMVEFPSVEHAKAWYDSPEYAEARALTPATFRGRVLMFVEGAEAKRA